MTAGPAVVAGLEAAGVDTVFGVLGLDGLRAALAEGLASDRMTVIEHLVTLRTQMQYRGRGTDRIRTPLPLVEGAGDGPSASRCSSDTEEGYTR